MTPQPLWLLAELTYRCPLQCPYCSNPLEFAGARFRNELGTEDWCRVFREAKALGVLQLGLSGGEPLLRADLERLVAAAHEVGLYTSLITSAYRLTKDRLAALRRSGLDHVQISIQAADEELSNYIAGTASYRDKLAAYRWTKELGFPLTVNVVLHRKNLHQVRDLIGLAESLGAERIELANTQFYGWAFHNRDALMPTRAQLEEGWRAVRASRIPCARCRRIATSWTTRWPRSSAPPRRKRASGCTGPPPTPGPSPRRDDRGARPRQGLRRGSRAGRPRPRCGRGRVFWLPRTERRRQDHDGPHPRHAAAIHARERPHLGA